jgi:MerR family redox-sensitive transcriptional activator SoxR
MSIGALAAQVGVRTSAIRYYEKIGLLPRAVRQSGRRTYQRRDAELLAVVHAGRRAGLGIADLRHLVRGFDVGGPASERWRAIAERKIEELDATVARARAMKRMLVAALGCQRLDVRECGRFLRASPA